MRRLALLSALAAFVPTLGAAVRLPALLADHMVVQRDRPVHVWGEAEPGEAVTATFRGLTRATAADALGRWSLYLPPGDAGGPYELTVAATNTLVLHDVLVGDVWIASGQSNMELPLRLAADPEPTIAAADCPAVRFFQVKPRPADHPLEDFAATEVRAWQPSRPEVAGEFSAVAYHFARAVQARTGVAVGIVQACWGGTPAEAWTSLRALAADPALLPVFVYRAEIAAGRATFLREQAKAVRDYERAVAEGRATGLSDPRNEWHPDFAGWAPGALYNGMIAPLTALPIEGVIWYQGESNSEPGQFPVYGRLFPALIADWRRAWGQGDFPFLYVQLANFGRLPPDWHWPEVREAQRRTLSVANTAMAVAIDLGEADQIHPRNKHDVGTRLALAARALAYGEAVVFSGPLFRQATPERGGLRVWFDHADGGLVVRGTKVGGFELAGADGRFVAAEAAVEGETVFVASSAVAAPRFVRYGWSGNPPCPLYNAAGLPAAPFTTSE